MKIIDTKYYLGNDMFVDVISYQGRLYKRYHGQGKTWSWISYTNTVGDSIILGHALPDILQNKFENIYLRMKKLERINK